MLNNDSLVFKIRLNTVFGRFRLEISVSIMNGERIYAIRKGKSSASDCLT